MWVKVNRATQKHSSTIGPDGAYVGDFLCAAIDLIVKFYTAGAPTRSFGAEYSMTTFGASPTKQRSSVCALPVAQRPAYDADPIVDINSLFNVPSCSLAERSNIAARRPAPAAQRLAIDGFTTQRNATLLARFTEVESGRNADRPELQRALHLAKVTGATLVIAKLDRLSRNAAFLLTLRDSGVKFAAVDLPEANDLTVGIMALVAQQEREAIPAQGGDRAERRSACGGPRAGGRGHSGRRRDEPAGDRRRAELAGHADPARRALVRLHGHEPARSARGAAMPQSRLMSLVEAVTNVAVGYGVAVVTQFLVSRCSGWSRHSGRTSRSVRSSRRSRWRGATCCGGVRGVPGVSARSGFGRVADGPPAGCAAHDSAEEAEFVAPALRRCGG